MGFEAQKTNRVRGHAFLRRYLTGKVLDIGCGPDLVIPTAQPFDWEQGDANKILSYLPASSFDCVHSSHCLEHMKDVPLALAQWWALVKPGGTLILVVPEEDLYEQGYWPSLFNTDHKATFRLDRPTSWSPISYDLRSLITALPDAEIIEIEIQDQGYDHALLRIRPGMAGRWLRIWGRLVLWVAWRHRSLLHRMGVKAIKNNGFWEGIERRLGKPVAQTDGDALAQIQAVVRRRHDGDRPQ